VTGLIVNNNASRELKVSAICDVNLDPLVIFLNWFLEPGRSLHLNLRFLWGALHPRNRTLQSRNQYPLVILWHMSQCIFCMHNPDQNSYACPTTERRKTTFPATEAERSSITSKSKLFSSRKLHVVHASCFSTFLWFSDRSLLSKLLPSVTYLRVGQLQLRLEKGNKLREINARQAC
jgi:hypothetical protein